MCCGGEVRRPPSGEVIPPGTTPGEVLIWDGTEWVPSSSGLLPGARPWDGQWGIPQLGNLTLMYMQNVNWTGAPITAANHIANAHFTVIIFPKTGGLLKYISAEVIGATVAPSQPLTFTAHINNVASPLTVTLAAALNASDSAFIDVIIPPASVNYRIELVVTAPAPPGSGATIPTQVHVGGYVNLP